MRSNNRPSCHAPAVFIPAAAVLSARTSADALGTAVALAAATTGSAAMVCTAKSPKPNRLRFSFTELMRGGVSTATTAKLGSASNN